MAGSCWFVQFLSKLKTDLFPSINKGTYIQQGESVIIMCEFTSKDDFQCPFLDVLKFSDVFLGEPWIPNGDSVFNRWSYITVEDGQEITCGDLVMLQ